MRFALQREDRHDDGFNEAPAFCGGEWALFLWSNLLAARFNEAPAFCGGEYSDPAAGNIHQLAASMRPPRSAGGNQGSTCEPAYIDMLQ